VATLRHSVIVVTWNAAEVLDRCLETVRGQEVTGGLETIVVDNASTDGTAAVLERHADHVRVIRNEENLGFSGGNNQGARAARGDVLHFLNSDTELLQNDALERLMLELAEPGVGLVGPRLENPDGTLQPSCRAHPTVARALLVGAGVHRVLPNALLARVFPAGWSHDEARDVDWVVGAALSVRADAFRYVGGFWPIHYAEEQELARQLQATAFRIRFLPAVRVMHVENVSNQQRFSLPERAARTAAAERAFIDRHYSARRGALIRRVTAAGHLGRAAILRRLGHGERADVYAAMAGPLLRPEGYSAGDVARERGDGAGGLGRVQSA
jgi:N-acetylglucosaminyl-diphospho-decaprenol L-rhamnosyltransferase